MSERLTAEEIYILRDRQRDTIGDIPVTWRELNCLLNLHDTIQRLRTLEGEQVTPEELEAVNSEAIGLGVYAWIIAAVCRGMLREVGGDG